MTSCDESRVFQEKNTVVPADLGKTAIRDYESDLEPEAKIMKSVTTDDHCSPLEEKPSQPRQTKAPLMDRVCEAKAQATTPPLPGKGWQCALCTYINNKVTSQLPCCEMCENPRGSAGEYTEGNHEGGWRWCPQITCAFRDNCYHQRSV